MPLINLEEWRRKGLPEEDSPKLTDSYIKKLICQSARRRGLDLQAKDIPISLVVEKRALIKKKRFTRQVQARLKDLKEKSKK